MSLQDELRTEAEEWDEQETDHVYRLMRRAADALDALTTELAAAKAERDALREALQKCRDHIVLHDDEGLAIHSDLIQAADAALTATESTAAECRRTIENEALERAALHFDEMNSYADLSASIVVNAIRALKG